mmetsp:Transcript_38088/g.68834  ORF Transcript_38088/g.68834 Transcript_38088/m.68834 type:complete len:115 (-) Transcript_38088:191-535(-)
MKWCELAGAHCAILPSPDVLVYALTRFAEELSGRTVTEQAIEMEEQLHAEQEEHDSENDWTTLPGPPARDAADSSPVMGSGSSDGFRRAMKSKTTSASSDSLFFPPARPKCESV